MTVEELETQMSNREYVRWAMYYALRAQQAELDEKMASARGRRVG